MEPPTGVILAGGKSRRFGSDKASALLHGRPLLQWVATALAEVCDRVLVVAAVGQQLPMVQTPAVVEVLRDEYEALGPLAGLVAAFTAAPGLCAVASCDAPLLEPGVFKLLAERMGGAEVACPTVAGRAQPLVALYRGAACLAPFRARLESGDRALRLAVEERQVVYVPEAEIKMADPELRSFRNTNTPEDLRALAAEL